MLPESHLSSLSTLDGYIAAAEWEQVDWLSLFPHCGRRSRCSRSWKASVDALLLASSHTYEFCAGSLATGRRPISRRGFSPAATYEFFILASP